MWHKITSALKVNREDASTTQGSDVMAKVFEQHPNLSHFHPNINENGQQSEPEPSSPSVHSKKNMFKRLSKAALKEEFDNFRAPSPFQQPPLPQRKVKNSIDLSTNGNGPEPSMFNSASMPRRSSFDMLRSSPPHSQDTTRSVKDTRQRPSLDILRESPPSLPSNRQQQAMEIERPLTPSAVDKLGAGSVRSILRDRNTPGTGQNVRFFPRDAFKVITPDHSLSTELREKPQPPIPQTETPFLDRLSESSPVSSTPVSVTRNGSGTKTRPALANLFGPLTEQENVAPETNKTDLSFSFSNAIGPVANPDFSNIFDTSQQLELPNFPPGLDFNANAPVFDASNSFDTSAANISYVVRDANLDAVSSTPHDKGKGKEVVLDDSYSFEAESVEVPAPAPEVIDESIFHRKDKSNRMLSPHHERSQSLSGQTVFYSMGRSGPQEASNEELEAAYPSSDLKPSMDSVQSSASATPPSVKPRSRAMSDTVFQTMLRATSSPKVPSPEADINDESSEGLVVYSGGPAEPDPFSAHANTYYTPQTMIPVTPPKGAPRHNRKTSKEENIIISLQTELALRTELCAQYEIDLKARDELVEILGKKLSDIDKDESKRRQAVRGWKKKVQELERACRLLEETVDHSRQESMERSVMDEASGEALRMLHRQIASLEREKGEWAKKEAALKEEVETLEGLVKDRSQDIMELKESLWTHEEKERALKEGVSGVQDAMDYFNDVSLVQCNDEELKKILLEKTTEETQRFHTIEIELRSELEEVKLKYEGLEVEKGRWQDEIDTLNQRLATRDEEYATLQAELEAQWQHTEQAADKIEMMEQEKTDLATERDALKADVQNLEEQVASMEQDWNEAENRRNDIETELQEVWNMKEEVEKERQLIEEELHRKNEEVQQATTDLQQCDTQLSQLEQEKQFSNENISRLEDRLRQRDQELAGCTQRAAEAEAQNEQLLDEISKVKREHSRLVNEQSRASQNSDDQRAELTARLEELVRSKAETDVELKTAKDRVAALKDEVDRQRRQIHALQQDSADKDLKIVQLNKQIQQEKEDIDGLNIALDSKQQELELLKRKIGVRGTAGSTPAQPSKVATSHRRESSIFTATPIASRPPSVNSDFSNNEETVKRAPAHARKNSVETTPQSAKIALARSARANGGVTTSSASTVKPVRDGSMGPPLKSRPSVTATPTPTARPSSSLARSSSARPAVVSPTGTPLPHRRVSSVIETFQNRATAVPKTKPVSRPTAVAEADEKENVAERRTPLLA